MKQKSFRKNKRGFSSDYIRIFMLFFTFFLVFCVVSSLSYFNANRQKREDLQLQMVSALNDQVQWMDNYIQKVYTASYSLLSNDDTATLLTQSALGNSNPLNNSAIVSSLNNLRASIYDHVSYIFLLNDQSNVYYSDGMCTAELYFDKLFRHRTQDAESWVKTSVGSAQMQVLPVDMVTEKYGANQPRTVIPVTVSRQISGRQWLLATEVSAVGVREQMEAHKLVDAQSFFCMDSQGTLFFNGSPYQFSEEELEFLLQSLNSPLLINPNYQIGRDQCYLVGQKGVGGLLYFTLIPSAALNEMVVAVNQPMLLFFLTAMVLFFLLTLVYTQRLYHPFHNMIGLLNRMESPGAPQTRSVPFSRLGQIDTLYRQKEDALIECFDEGVHLLVTSGEQPTGTKFQKRLLQNTHLSEDHLCCMILQFSFREAYFNEFSEEEQQVVSMGLGNLLSGILNGSFYCYVTEYNRGSFACFFENALERRQQMQNVLATIQNVFQYDIAYCHLRGGLSREHSGSEALFHTLMEALTALEFFSEELTTLDLQQYDSQKVSFQPLFTHKQRNQLFHLLSSGEEAAISCFVRELEREARTQRLYYPLYRIMLRQLQETGREFLLTQTGKQTAQEGWKEFLRVQECCLMEQEAFSGDLAQLCRLLNLCANIKEAEEPAVPKLEPVFAFIKEHLSEDLYLERIAQAVALNPKYLSRIFKEHVGATLSEYISHARVNRAKELLSETAQNIAEIGEAVGFENRTTFFRTFKKLEGVSPNDFRKMLPPK